MATSSALPTRLSKDAQASVMKYFHAVVDTRHQGSYNMREQLLNRDLQYYRENDWTVAHQRAQLANRMGDSKRLQNVQVPIVMPQVEAQLAELASIFLTGYPIFGVASSPENADAALGLETLIADNALRFGWVRQFLLSMRDGLKYNFMATEVDWSEIKTATILNDLDSNAVDSQGLASSTIYAGNNIQRLDLYNSIFDTRVAPANMHTDGEFAGYSKLHGRISLKRMLAQLPKGTLINATEALESGEASISSSNAGSDYYVPTINSQALIDPQEHQQDWLTWLGIADTKIRYASSYEVHKLYARLIPSEHGIQVSNAPNTPRVFKLIVINRKVLVYAQIMSNAHDFLPIVCGQPEEDGLGWQTKGFAENIEPYQQLSTGLWAATMEGQRRAVYDRLLYDPDRVRKADINSPDSVGRIAVRPKSYSRNVSEGVAALPYRMENQAGVMQMIQTLGGMADEAGGSNKSNRGQFTKGNRTRFEYEDVMGGSAGRTRTRALALEHQYFSPIKEIVKLNSLQFQTAAEFTNQSTGATVAVQPEQMRKYRLDFKMSDGMLPTSKMISGDLIEKIAQFGMAVPAVNAEYDIMGMLMYNWKQSGASWLPSFKRDDAGKQQQLALMQQADGGGQPGNPNQAPGVSNGPTPQQ